MTGGRVDWGGISAGSGGGTWDSHGCGYVQAVDWFNHGASSLEQILQYSALKKYNYKPVSDSASACEVSYKKPKINKYFLTPV